MHIFALTYRTSFRLDLDRSGEGNGEISDKNSLEMTSW